MPPADSNIEQLQTGLAKELPQGIEVEFDEQFEAMFSYKAKNYALLTRDGDVIIKGGALKSRGLEKFQRVFLEEMIKRIMEGKAETISDLRNQFEKKIRNREWHIDMLMKTDTLQDSLEKYRAKIAGSARNRAAAYELALASGRSYKPGDQVSYYIKSTAKKVPAKKAPVKKTVAKKAPAKKPSPAKKPAVKKAVAKAPAKRPAKTPAPTLAKAPASPWKRALKSPQGRPSEPSSRMPRPLPVQSRTWYSLPWVTLATVRLPLGEWSSSCVATLNSEWNRP